MSDFDDTLTKYKKTLVKEVPRKCAEMIRGEIKNFLDDLVEDLQIAEAPAIVKETILRGSFVKLAPKGITVAFGQRWKGREDTHFFADKAYSWPEVMHLAVSEYLDDDLTPAEFEAIAVDLERAAAKIRAALKRNPNPPALDS